MTALSIAMQRERGEADSDSLAERAVAGDREAREELLRDHERLIYAAVHRAGGESLDTEDAFQRACVKILTGLDGFDTGRKFSTWAWRVAYNSTVDLLRKRRERGELPESLDSGDPGPAERDEQVRTVKQMLDLLDGENRALFELYFLQGMQLKEAAELLGIKENTAKSRVRRKLQYLREEMNRDE